MEHKDVILDVISPLVNHKEDINIILLEQENLRDHSYVIYCNEEDLPRLIGRRGVIANSVREVVNTLAKLENKHIRIKFEAKK